MFIAQGREKIMDVSTNIVIGDINDIEEIGEASSPIENWRGFEIRGIDPAKMATLHAILTGQTFDDAYGEYLLAFDASEQGPWVAKIPDEPMERLAVLEDDVLEQIGEELAATEEFERDGWPVEEVQIFLAELAALAGVAIVQRKTMFIWTMSR